MPSEQTTVAIVGGGISGLTAARELARAGRRVQLFDKGRGVSGRSSTRYAAEGAHFDHGAQYFTVRSDRFRIEVDEWLASGVAAEWRPRLVSIDGAGQPSQRILSSEPPARYVGTPGMNAIAKRLADQAREAGAEITPAVRVASLKRNEGRWALSDKQGTVLCESDLVLVTAPGPQAAELLAASPAMANAARSAEMTGCWTAMVAFRDPIAASFDAAFINDTPEASPLAWAARNSSKPSRPCVETSGECWVLHASAEWSEANLRLDPNEAARHLTEAFFKLGVSSGEPNQQHGHLWRYAIPQEPLKETHIEEERLGLYACGDWCGGPRVEGALLSGLSAAEAITQR